MNQQFFHSYKSPFGLFTIVWNEMDSNSLITRIYLSDSEENSELKASIHKNMIRKAPNSSIDSLGKKIQKFLKGENIKFDLELLDFNMCYNIQKKVLMADYDIPRGWISTYKRIATKIGLINGARVVGNSLANNPFPLIIPCHRAIKSNGELGGFQGGINMKRALLELEGLRFNDSGKVNVEKFFY